MNGHRPQHDPHAASSAAPSEAGSPRGIVERLRPALTASLSDVFGLTLREPSVVRAQQIRSVMQVVPFLSIANLVNGVGLTVLAWGEKPRALLTIWFCCLLAVTAKSLLACLRGHRKPRPHASARAIRSVVASSAMLGVLWGLAFLLFFPGASPMLATATAIIGTGVIYGGLTIIAVPAATLAFIALATAGAVPALLFSGSAMTVVVMPAFVMYIGIAVVVTLSSAVQQRERIGGRAEIEQHKEDIDMLLTDFQSSGRDWLWRVDADGRLTHISPDMARAIGIDAARLQDRSGREILRLVQDRRARRALIDIMRNPRAVRDIDVPCTRRDETVWWSLSGYVLTDQVGRFEGMRGVARDVTEARDERRRMSKMATSDSLTGLANRFAFDTHFAKALGRLNEGPTVALHYLDLDGFKPINDTYGHPAGDQLLRTVAERLKACLRDTDVVARLGGDEFAVLQANVRRSEDANRLAERIIETVTQPYSLDGVEVRVGTSVGVHIVGEERDAGVISERADTALYRAKADGKGVYRVYSPDMRVEADARRALERDLRLAFAADELELRYQPVTDLETDSIVAAEALLYWEHPTRGVVSPAEFVPLAEETGLIVDMGAWVIERACRDAALWDNKAVVMVNLSHHQLKRDDLGDLVDAALVRSGLLPSRLSLEISENGLPSSGPDMVKLEARLGQVKALGVQLGLDDFGTGATSLSLLRRGTFDILKLDRTCLEDAMKSDADAALVCTIAALASQLGIRTVAEGVESRAQLDWIRLSGWDWAQGYLLAGRMTVCEIARALGNDCLDGATDARGERDAGRAVARDDAAGDDAARDDAAGGGTRAA